MHYETKHDWGRGISSKVLRPTHFLGGGQKQAKLHMRLLRPTKTGRGSEGQISHEAIKSDRPLPTVVNQESEIRPSDPSQFLSALITSCKIWPSDPLPVFAGLNVQKACRP